MKHPFQKKYFFEKEYSSQPHGSEFGVRVNLLTTRKIRNWHIHGQAYHLMLKTAMVYLSPLERTGSWLPFQKLFFPKMDWSIFNLEK